MEHVKCIQVLYQQSKHPMVKNEKNKVNNKIVLDDNAKLNKQAKVHTDINIVLHKQTNDRDGTKFTE